MYNFWDILIIKSDTKAHSKRRMKGHTGFEELSSALHIYIVSMFLEGVDFPIFKWYVTEKTY